MGASLQSGMQGLSAAIAFSNVQWDLALIAFFALAFFLYGLTIGRKFVLSAVLALYFSFAIVRTLPSLNVVFGAIGIDLPSTASLVLFLLLFLCIGWLLAATPIGAFFHFAQRGLGAWWQIFVLSILGTGFFVTEALAFLPKGIFTPSPIVQQVFVQDPAPFLWVLAPVIFLLLLRHELEE